MGEPDALSVAIATVAAFAERAEAQRVVVLVDRGEEAEPAMVECVPGEVLELTADGEARHVAPAVPSLPLPALRPAPATALAADPETGELSAPLGVVAHLADAVLALARLFGGRSVATAEFATRDPAVPLTIAAREGEPVVLALADRYFSLPAG